MELHTLTIHQLHQLLKSRQVSSVEATRSLLARIEATDSRINAFITVAADQAMTAVSVGSSYSGSSYAAQRPSERVAGRS